MNLYHLRVFLTVAEHEHITRASEAYLDQKVCVLSGSHWREDPGWSRTAATPCHTMLTSGKTGKNNLVLCQGLPTSLSPISYPNGLTHQDTTPDAFLLIYA
jgi:hypothetical protein